MPTKNYRSREEIDASNGCNIEFAFEKKCTHCKEDFTGPAILGFLSRSTQAGLSVWFHFDCAKKLVPINKKTSAQCKKSKEDIGTKPYYLLGGKVHVLANLFEELLILDEEQRYEACLQNSSGQVAMNNIIYDLPDHLVKKYGFEKAREKLNKKKEKENAKIERVVEEVIKALPLDLLDLPVYDTMSVCDFEIRVKKEKYHITFGFFPRNMTAGGIRVSGVGSHVLGERISKRLSERKPSMILKPYLDNIDLFPRCWSDEPNSEATVPLRHFHSLESSIKAFAALKLNKVFESIEDRDLETLKTMLLTDDDEYVRKFAESLLDGRFLQGLNPSYEKLFWSEV